MNNFDRVSQLKQDIQNATQEISEIQLFCKHNSQPYILPNGVKLSHLPCDKCGKTWTNEWWCPESLNNFCDYSTDDGYIDEDSCRYCREPRERK